MHRADAGSRRPAPSRTRPPPPARWSRPTPTRPGTPAAPSSRSRPRPGEPAIGSRPGGCHESIPSAGRTRRPARGGSCASGSPGPVLRRAQLGKTHRPSLPGSTGAGQSSLRPGTRPGSSTGATRRRGEQAWRRHQEASKGDPHEPIARPTVGPRRSRLRLRRAEPPRGVRRHLHEPLRRHGWTAPARGRRRRRAAAAAGARLARDLVRLAPGHAGAGPGLRGRRG